uniref:Spaetzle domain-containing protein n=1 Tax=Aceria tosichella TaxID=561515 RepID=A0A6G1SAN3_9ACAR
MSTLLPQPAHRHWMSPARHRRQQHHIAQVDVIKLETSCCKFMYSVILFIFIQMIQIKHSESTLTTRSTLKQPLEHHRQGTNSLYNAEPIVFNTESLYKAHHHRLKRSSPSESQKFVDACQSRMEVLTPYYATNSKGKLRTIVNSELMQQAIQVETCSSASQSTTSTTQSSAPNRCNAQPDCGCEQKYKWHRLLVMDATDEADASKGLFMDWFLFPSNCVCRCRSGLNSTRNFLRTIMASKRHHNTD